MEVFRLARKKYADKLSGAGAAIRGGRWNSRGTELIYTSHSRALAMAEVMVYLSLENLPDDYQMLSIKIPREVKVTELDANSLPSNWNAFPHSKDTQGLGDAFVRSGKFCVLKTPSAVVPGDYNFLINPAHKDFPKIKVVEQVDFPFDQRLF